MIQLLEQGKFSTIFQLNPFGREGGKGSHEMDFHYLQVKVEILKKSYFSNQLFVVVTSLILALRLLFFYLLYLVDYDFQCNNNLRILTGLFLLVVHRQE